MPTAPIPRFHHSSPQIREHLIRGEPCVITDCPLINKLVDLWTFDHLATTTFDGSERLQCEMTLKDGRVVWDWNGRAATDYRQMDSNYGIRRGEYLVMPPGA